MRSSASSRDSLRAPRWSFSRNSTFPIAMSQGSRPDRVADQIRGELANLLAREVHDPGIGFVTLTRVQVSPDLQQARVFYTSLGPTGPGGDAAKARQNSERALERATPFLR